MNKVLVSVERAREIEKEWDGAIKFDIVNRSIVAIDIKNPNNNQSLFVRINSYSVDVSEFEQKNTYCVRMNGVVKVFDTAEERYDYLRELSYEDDYETYTKRGFEN